MDDESPERLGPHGSMGHCGRGPHAQGLAPKNGRRTNGSRAICL